MWKNVTIGVMSVALIFTFMLYLAARKLAIEAGEKLAETSNTATAAANNPPR